jgi:hypothetical protein
MKEDTAVADTLRAGPGRSRAGGIGAMTSETRRIGSESSAGVLHVAGFGLGVTGTSVTLAGSQDGLGATTVADRLVLRAFHNDGTIDEQSIDYSSGCTKPPSARPPINLLQAYPNLFKPGFNDLQVEMWNDCGNLERSSALWISN